MATRRRARKRLAAAKGIGQSQAGVAPRGAIAAAPPETPAGSAAGSEDQAPAAKVPASHETVALLCAVTALAMACVALVPQLAYAGWKTSALVRMDAQEAPLRGLVHDADPGFVLVSPWDSYDGAEYYLVARDPLGVGSVHFVHPNAADLSYRYEHPGYPWLAFLFSLGNAPVLPDVMVWLNLALFVLSAYLMSLLAVQIGRSPWWGALVALDPGLLMALGFDTTEITLAAAVLLGLLLWLRRHPAAGVAIAAACFAKEIGWALPVGLGLYEMTAFVRAQYPSIGGTWRHRTASLVAAARQSGLLRRLLVLSAGPALSSLWFAYVEIVISPNAGPTSLPRDVPRSLALIPVRLLPVAAVWALPLLAAGAAMLVKRPSRRARPRLPLAWLLAPAAVAMLLGLFALVALVPFGLGGTLGRAAAAITLLGQRLGFRFFWLAPVSGLVQTLTIGARSSFGAAGVQLPLGLGMPPVAIAVTGLFLLGLLAALRLRTPAEATFVIVALPMLSLYPAALLYPEDLIRTVAVPFLLLALALLARRNNFEDVAAAE